jgi:putative transposase
MARVLAVVLDWAIAFTGVLAGNGISMDGKGDWRDNVFVERQWRSIKYEEVGVSAGLRNVSEARNSIGRAISTSTTTSEP